MHYAAYGAPWPPHQGAFRSLVRGVMESAKKGAGLRVLRVGEAPEESARLCGDMPERLLRT